MKQWAAVIWIAVLNSSAAGYADDFTAARYERLSKELRYSAVVDVIDVSLHFGKVPRITVLFTTRTHRFGFTAVGENALSLLTHDRRPELDRYVLHTGDDRSLEFRDRSTGRAYLPYSFALQGSLVLPVCLDDAGRFRSRCRLLDDDYVLSTRRASATPQTSEPKIIELSDDLIVGTSRNFRDVDGRRIAREEFLRNPNLDYTYRPLDEKDMNRMLRAGFNYFDRVTNEQLEFLFDKPVFFDVKDFHGKTRPSFPEIFYHPGFWGVEDFLDEPAYIFLEDAPLGKGDLAAMAKAQQLRTQRQYDRKARGREKGIMTRLGYSEVFLDGIELVEPPFPIWEELYSTGCYQLHVPVSGFIHEGRYRHPETIDLFNETFRTRLPRSPKTMFAFYFAFLRGAARVFDKDWGISIYGQADPDVSLQALTTAYDKGARYLWFWSSDRDHHLPFEEQLQLADSLQRHVRSHPRGTRRQLLRAAGDAVVLPYGFTFSISDWQKRQVEDLWQREDYSIKEGRMADGTPYYSVLRCAAEAMERLVDSGKEFDVVVEVPELKDAGYQRLHRVVFQARARGYTYPWWIHYKLHFVLAALVVFLIVFRTYRIVRWLRRRRRAN